MVNGRWILTGGWWVVGSDGWRVGSVGRVAGWSLPKQCGTAQHPFSFARHHLYKENDEITLSNKTLTLSRIMSDPLRGESCLPPTPLPVHLTLQFMEICWQLLPYLDLHRVDPQPVVPQDRPPYDLPPNVVSFIADCFYGTHSDRFCQVIEQTWRLLSNFIWQTRQTNRVDAHLLDKFLRFGTSHNIGWLLLLLHLHPIHTNPVGFFTIGPPTRYCRDPVCAEQQQGRNGVLGEPKTHSAILFTKEYGPLPVYSTSLYCRSKYGLPVLVCN
jgi:CxC5 like cysteine cluster associated with KDZ transposases